MKNIIIILIFVSLIGCKTKEPDIKKSSDYNVVVPENPLENFYYIDRAKTENNYKKMNLEMYTTKKMYAGWRPDKTLNEDENPIRFDGTWVKFLAGKDQIFSKETTTELEIDRYGQEIMLNDYIPEEKKTARNQEGYTIPYKKVQPTK